MNFPQGESKILKQVDYLLVFLVSLKEILKLFVAFVTAVKQAAFCRTSSCSSKNINIPSRRNF